VAVAGVLGALKATNTRLQDHTFLFQGAGEVRQQNVVFVL
jgi:malic enzyme